MFTGIVETTGKVGAVGRRGRMLAVSIDKPSSWKLTTGQSISVDGICLTVTGSTARAFTAEIMPETLTKTTAAAWELGRMVNLERALRARDLLNGHLIQGHVSATGVLKDIERQGASRLYTLRLPGNLVRQVMLHGSLAVNGVSLTVARRHGPLVTVALIPYTLKHTNLGLLKTGDAVNVETDFLIRGTMSRNAARRVRKGKARTKRV